MYRTAVMWALAMASVALAPAAPVLEWVLRSPPFAMPIGGFTALARGAGQFAGGDSAGGLWRSSDGVVWQRQSIASTLPIDTLRFQNDRFFAFAGVGAPEGKIGITLTSTDARAWQPLGDGSGLETMQVLSDVAWTGSQFVAVGYDYARSRTLSATSADGLTWRVVLIIPNVVPNRLAMGGGRLVAVGAGPGGNGLIALASTDGASWDATPVSVGAGGAPTSRDVAFGNGVFVAAGGRAGILIGDNRGYIVSSTDGKTWTERTPPRTLQPLRAIGFSQGRFTLVGEVPYAAHSSQHVPLAYESTDGQTFTEILLGVERTRAVVRLNAVAAEPTGLLVAGIGGVLVRWDSAQGWTRLDAGWDPVGDPVWVRDEFWFPAHDSLLRTRDGTVWFRHRLRSAEQPTGDPVAPFRALTSTGDAFVGLLYTSQPTQCYRSVDGVAWTQANIGGGYYDAIASGGGLVVAVGSGNIACSRDHGATWTSTRSVTRNRLAHVAFGNGLFVALSDETTHTSRDGVNWTTAALPPNTFGSAMAFLQGRFFRPGGVVASGVGNILATDNGLDWKPVLSALPGYDRFYSVSTPVAGPDGLYCSAVLVRGATESRAILFSPDGANWQVHQASEIVPIGYGGGVFLGRGVDGVYSAAISPAARLANLSSLGRIAGAPLITGFSIAAPEGRRVLLRSTGPGLAAFGVPDPVATLSSRVFDATGRSIEPGSPATLPLGSSETPAAVAQRVGAFPQSPQDRAELVRLRPGSYTLQTATEAGAAGSVLAEIYDAEPPGASGLLGNLSARGVLAVGDAVFTAGFVIAGERAKTVLVRGIGPGLRKFGVTTVATDPRLELFGVDGARLAENDDWNSSPESAAARIFGVQQGAFALDEAAKDAALVTSLSPGAYTIQISDRTRAGGEVLIEVYEIR